MQVKICSIRRAIPHNENIDYSDIFFRKKNYTPLNCINFSTISTYSQFPGDQENTNLTSKYKNKVSSFFNMKNCLLYVYCKIITSELLCRNVIKFSVRRSYIKVNVQFSRKKYCRVLFDEVFACLKVIYLR